MTSWTLSRVPVKPLYNTSTKIFISSVSMLYLQKVLLIHLKKCVFYIIYKLELPLRVSFKCIGPSQVPQHENLRAHSI